MPFVAYLPQYLIFSAASEQSRQLYATHASSTAPMPSSYCCHGVPVDTESFVMPSSIQSFTTQHIANAFSTHRAFVSSMPVLHLYDSVDNTSVYKGSLPRHHDNLQCQHLIYFSTLLRRTFMGLDIYLKLTTDMLNQDPTAGRYSDILNHSRHG